MSGPAHDEGDFHTIYDTNQPPPPYSPPPEPPVAIANNLLATEILWISIETFRQETLTLCKRTRIFALFGFIVILPLFSSGVFLRSVGLWSFTSHVVSIAVILSSVIATRRLVIQVFRNAFILLNTLTMSGIHIESGKIDLGTMRKRAETLMSTAVAFTFLAFISLMVGMFRFASNLTQSSLYLGIGIPAVLLLLSHLSVMAIISRTQIALPDGFEERVREFSVMGGPSLANPILPIMDADQMMFSSSSDHPMPWNHPFHLLSALVARMRIPEDPLPLYRPREEQSPRGSVSDALPHPSESTTQLIHHGEPNALASRMTPEPRRGHRIESSTLESGFEPVQLHDDHHVDNSDEEDEDDDDDDINGADAHDEMMDFYQPGSSHNMKSPLILPQQDDSDDDQEERGHTQK